MESSPGIEDGVLCLILEGGGVGGTPGEKVLPNHTATVRTFVGCKAPRSTRTWQDPLVRHNLPAGLVVDQAQAVEEVLRGSWWLVVVRNPPQGDP